MTPQQTFKTQLQRADRARAGRLRGRSQMTTSERVAAMRRRELTLGQLAAPSARHPDQIPTVNAEFKWIALRTHEASE